MPRMLWGGSTNPSEAQAAELERRLAEAEVRVAEAQRAADQAKSAEPAELESLRAAADEEAMRRARAEERLAEAESAAEAAQGALRSRLAAVEAELAAYAQAASQSEAAAAAAGELAASLEAELRQRLAVAEGERAAARQDAATYLEQLVERERAAEATISPETEIEVATGLQRLAIPTEEAPLGGVFEPPSRTPQTSQCLFSDLATPEAAHLRAALQGLELGMGVGREVGGGSSGSGQMSRARAKSGRTQRGFEEGFGCVWGGLLKAFCLGG